MSDGVTQPPQSSHLWLEALEWHTALREGDAGDLTESQFQGWRHWYAESAHRRVFDELDLVLRDRRRYVGRLRVSPRDLEADEYDPSIPVREWRQNHSSTPVAHTVIHRMSALTPPRGSWRKAIAGLALATAAVLLGLLILQPQWIGMESGVSAQTAYLTGLGELKALQLADGSRITLGARTRLVVDYTARARTVHLLYGEAWFQDKDIPNRPFIVTAGGGRITAVGTAFVVNRDSDHVVVTVTAGIVDVSTSVSAPRSQHEFAAPPAPHLPVVRVMPGEAVTYGGGAIGPVVHASAPAATSWTHGRLVFDDVPLRYVVENVDRYWSRRITVSGPAGDLQFSGQIYEGGIEDWLRGLPQIFPVKTEQTGDSVTVILSSQPNTTAMKHGS